MFNRNNPNAVVATVDLWLKVYAESLQTFLKDTPSNHLQATVKADSVAQESAVAFNQFLKDSNYV